MKLQDYLVTFMTIDSSFCKIYEFWWKFQFLEFIIFVSRPDTLRKFDLPPPFNFSSSFSVIVVVDYYKQIIN